VQCTWRKLYFSSVSLLQVYRFSRNVTHHTACLFYKLCKFDVDRSKIKGTFLGKQSTFSSVLRLLNQILQERHTWPFAYLVSNDVRKRALYVAHSLNFFCISASVLEGFRKLHASHPACPGCKCYIFGTDRCTIKCTLLGEIHSFSTVSWILLVTLFQKHQPSCFMSAVSKWRKCGRDRSKIERTLANFLLSLFGLEIDINITYSTSRAFPIDGVSLVQIEL